MGQQGENILVRLQTRIPLEDDAQKRVLFQGIANAFLQGLHRGPPLPSELVRMLFVTGGLTTKYSIRAEIPFKIETLGPVKRKCWIVTNAFEPPLLSKLAGVRLKTISGHQGWTTHPHEGSWSWFELAIVSPGAEDSAIDYDSVKQRPDGTRLSWVSHYHPIDQGREVKEFDGTLFDNDHEIWRSFDYGDKLAVFGCAERRFWECIGQSAILQFDEYFDPLV